MKTYFAMHCITNRNKDDKFYDKQLKNLGYDESLLPKEQLPSQIDIAQGQVDEPLIEKGRKQAEFLGKQLNDADLGKNIQRIYCGNQKRCYETAKIIASKIGLDEKNIFCDKRIDARNYGIIAEQKMDTDKLKHFWKYKIDFDTLKTIAFYLVAPEKIGAEKKSDFVARVKDFIHDKKNDFDNSLIVAGSDFWGVVQDENYFYTFKGEGTDNLKRGQLALIDFSKEKEQKTISSKNNVKEK